MSSPLEQDLVGTWRHSHEEDTARERVYRRDTFAFPPARGRTGYEFKPDHTCVVLGLSPRDGTARSPGRWDLSEGSPPQLVVTHADARQEQLRVIALDRERLLLAR